VNREDCLWHRTAVLKPLTCMPGIYGKTDTDLKCQLPPPGGPIEFRGGRKGRARAPSSASLGPITLEAKQTGERKAGSPHMRSSGA